MYEERERKISESIAEGSRSRRVAKDVRIYQAWIRNALQEQEPYIEEYQRNNEFYVGQQEQGMTQSLRDRPYIANEDILVVNRVLPALRTTNASIMFKIPWFTLNPRGLAQDSDIQNLEIGEYTLNYVLNTPAHRFLRASRLAVLAAELGIGGLKMTYTPDEGIEDESGKMPEYGKIVHSVDEQGQEKMDVQGGNPKLDKNGNIIIRSGNRVLLDSRNIAKEYDATFVDFRMCAFDPEGTNDFLDSRRFAQRKTWTYDEFLSNTMLTNKENIAEQIKMVDDREMNYMGTRRSTRRLDSRPGSTGLYSSRRTSATERDMSRLWGWQIWDFEKHVVVYMVDDYDKLVGVEPIPRYIDHSPYTWLKFNEVLSEFLPYPDVTAARPVARAYNRSRSQRLTHQARSTRKYEIGKNSIDGPNMEVLKFGEDMSVVVTKTGNNLKPIDSAPLESSIYDDERNIADMSEIMASAPEARGSAQSGTATQAQIVENRGTLGEEDKRLLVSICLSEFATKTYNCIQATMDQSMAVRINGPKGNAWQRSVAPSEITMDAEATCDVLDLRPHNEATERADSSQILQTLGPAAFLSKTFSRWFWKVRRVEDPAMRDELEKVSFLLATGGMDPAAGGAGAAGGEGAGAAGGAPQAAKPGASGGPKPPAPDRAQQGHTFAGRSAGRNLRTESGGS